jgi:hypothetical protein
MWNTHMTAHLLPLSHSHSVLHLSSQQNSDPRTKSDRKYFSIIHPSNTVSLPLSLSLSLVTASYTHKRWVRASACKCISSHGRSSCSQQLEPPEGGVTYVAVLARPVAPIQPSGSLMHTAFGPVLPAVSSKTANRHISSDISGPFE